MNHEAIMEFVRQNPALAIASLVTAGGYLWGWISPAKSPHQYVAVTDRYNKLHGYINAKQQSMEMGINKESPIEVNSKIKIKKLQMAVLNITRFAWIYSKHYRDSQRPDLIERERQQARNIR